MAIHHSLSEQFKGLVWFVVLTTMSPLAMAAVIDINTDSNTPQTLVNTDILNVASGVSLTSTSATPTITWNGASGSGPVVNNLGNIRNIFDTGSESGRAINMNFNGNSSFTLNNGSASNSFASIVSGNDVFRINKSIGSGTVVVNNYGTLQSTGANGDTNGQALDFNANSSSTGSVTINNFSSGVMTAADADAIRPGKISTINNWGSISGNTTGDSGNDGIDYQDAGKSGSFNNYGSTSSITGARHGITAKEAITIYNEGVIKGFGGSGLNIDNTSNSPIMQVTNAASGRIIGNPVSGADADGIDIDRLGAIVNRGQISALGIAGGTSFNEAIAIGGGSIDNFLGGLIYSDQRAITVDDSNLGNAFAAMEIYNEGVITGANGEAIHMTSSFANMLTNKGEINGSIVMGGGDDTVKFYTDALQNGFLDGNDGSDTLELLGNGVGLLGNARNIETLRIDGGNWSFDGDQDYHFGSFILDDAELSLGGSASIFVASISGADILGDKVLNITGNGRDIFYDAKQSSNDYLGGQWYHLANGGMLKPIPEPHAMALLLAGLGLLGLVRSRTKSN